MNNQLRRFSCVNTEVNSPAGVVIVNGDFVILISTSPLLSSTSVSLTVVQIPLLGLSFR